MPRTCTVCLHADRSDIDQALIAREPFRHIASRTGTSTTALQRHKRDHIPLTLSKAHEAAEVAHADDLLAQIRHLQARAMGILDKAEKAGDLRTALAAIGQAKGVLDLQAKMTGETEGEEQQPHAVPIGVFLNNVIALPKQPGVEPMDLDDDLLIELGPNEYQRLTGE